MTQTRYYFYFYAIVSGIALVVHLIINWRFLFCRQGDMERVGEPEFRRFLTFLSLFFVADVLWGILAELKMSRLLYVDTILYFLAMAMTVCAWARFVVAYLEMGGWPRACMLWLGRGLQAFFFAAMVFNVFSSGCFSINAQGEYMAAALRHVMLALLVAFNALNSGLTLMKLLHTDGAMHRRNTMVFAFGITMILAIVFQYLNPFLPLYALGCLFGCCLLHVFVFEDERDEWHQKEMLAREYEARFKAEREANQAKSLFFSTVSHDIRTPLNAIIGFADLLERGEKDAAKRSEYIASIRSSGKVLARLVDDILDLSKLECGKMELVEEPTYIPALVREVISVCEVVRVRKSLNLKSEIGEFPWVSVDPQRVRQILFNLLSNAYKYTNQGTITVRADWHDGTLTLSVEDTGEGISEENIARILQPFVQVVDKNHRDGTGMGLPICHKLVTLMGGELTIASKVGVGSTFTITLRNVKTATPPDSRPNDMLRPGRVPSRVLVVDDSSVNRAVLKAMLAKIGVGGFAMAENGREALATLKGDPNFDLVLTDLWMPEMDGYGLLRAIRADEALSHLPVYLLTADVEAQNQAEAGGFTGILFKPVTMEKLLALFPAEPCNGQFG